MMDGQKRVFSEQLLKRCSFVMLGTVMVAMFGAGLDGESSCRLTKDANDYFASLGNEWSDVPISHWNGAVSDYGHP